ncbi:MAG: CRISPR-associated endonuclease Cas2 [Candidatus Pacebacteria bacterium]|nr:CRISPR-associated endonuclease Cas2 [Candidatus Paceibacterota bacterium]
MLNMTRDKRLRLTFHRENDKAWNEIDRKSLYQTIRMLRLNKLAEVIKDANTEKIRLTQKGKARWLEYQFNNLTLEKKKKWDKKWRIVLFDVPEEKKKVRDALRRKLKKLGFLEFQKSVFVFPFPCHDEINFVINFFDAEEYVYYIEAPISPDTNLRKHFNL